MNHARLLDPVLAGRAGAGPGAAGAAGARIERARRAHHPGDDRPGLARQRPRPTFEYLIPTELDRRAGGAVDYPPSVRRTFAFAASRSTSTTARSRFRSTLRAPAPDRRRSRSRLRYQACSDRICLPPSAETDRHTCGLDAPADTIALTAAALAAGAQVAASSALLGGLILNAMPCVLPVLSLKVFGLVRSAGDGRRRGGARRARHRGRHPGLVLGPRRCAAIAATSAGAAVGWGVQFQQPALRRASSPWSWSSSASTSGAVRDPAAGAAGARLDAAGRARRGAWPATSPPASSPP